MCEIRILFLLLVVIPAFAAGQDYYPLNVGNEWFYRSIDAPSDSDISSSVRVTADSLFPNGHKYFVLSNDDIMGGRYLRFDSATVYYFSPFTGQEQRVFKLDGSIGDTVQISWGPYGYVRLEEIDTVIVLGISQRVVRFVVDGLLFARVAFCQKFGPMIEWRYDDPPPPWPNSGRELVGCVIDTGRYGVTLGVADQAAPPRPWSFVLFQNYPNPFNPSTTISYYLDKSCRVHLRIVDCLGRGVRTLVDDVGQLGRTAVRWDGRDDNGLTVHSGIYVYELTADGVRTARKLLFLK